MNEKPYEDLLQKTILDDLERGRPNFDRPHTLAVVIKLKSIITSLKYTILSQEIDEDALIIAAYAHDWGYADLFKDGQLVQYGEGLKSVKPLHMELGANKVKVLLTNSAFDFMNAQRKQRVVHLVLNHDKIESLAALDEIILMEADTLGALDTELVRPTFDKESRLNYLNKSVLPNRKPMFRTDWGKKELDRLIENWVRYDQDPI